MSYLTLPDTVTIEQESETVTGEHSGRPIGRGSTTTFVIKAQLEVSKDRRSTSKEGVRAEEKAGELVFDRRLLRRKGYTPRRGDHVVKIKHYETGEEDDLDLWISDPKNDGAGALLRCMVTDRTPQR